MDEYRDKESSCARDEVVDFVEKKKSELRDRRAHIIQLTLPDRLDNGVFAEEDSPSPHTGKNARKFVGELIALNKILKRIDRLKPSRNKSVKHIQSELNMYQDRLIDYANQEKEMSAISGTDEADAIKEVVHNVALSLNGLIDSLSKYRDVREGDH